MSDLGADGEPVHSSSGSGEPVWPYQRGPSALAWMEKMTSKTNDTSTLDHRPLADSELDAVSGGITCVAGRHFDEVSIDVGGGGGGGGATTPAGAWNACLGVFNYPPEIAPEPPGHGLPLGKCEAYNRVYAQCCGSS